MPQRRRRLSRRRSRSSSRRPDWTKHLCPASVTEKARPRRLRTPSGAGQLAEFAIGSDSGNKVIVPRQPARANERYGRAKRERILQEVCPAAVSMRRLRPADVGNRRNHLPRHAHSAAGLVSGRVCVASLKTGTSARTLQRVMGLGSYQTPWMWQHKLRRWYVPDGSG